MRFFSLWLLACLILVLMIRKYERRNQKFSHDFVVHSEHFYMSTTALLGKVAREKETKKDIRDTLYTIFTLRTSFLSVSIDISISWS